MRFNNMTMFSFNYAILIMSIGAGETMNDTKFSDIKW